MTTKPFIDYFNTLPLISKSEKEEIILFKQNPGSFTLPQRFKGPELRRERKRWKKSIQKMTVKPNILSSGMIMELIVMYKKKELLLLTKEEIIPKLKMVHNDDYHNGRDKMLKELQLYYFSFKKEIIENFLAQCQVCLTKKRGLNKPPIKPNSFNETQRKSRY